MLSAGLYVTGVVAIVMGGVNTIDRQLLVSWMIWMGCECQQWAYGFVGRF